MASKNTATKLAALQSFFLSEVKQEVASGFSRLKRVPSSQVIEKMRFFATLNADDQRAFLDCCSYWASVHYGFVVRMDRLNPTAHPFFSRWSRGPMWTRDFDDVKSVPLLRSMVQQYKIDRHNRVQSSVTRKQFEHAAAVRSVKAPELRKRVRATLKAFGYYESDFLGNYWCKIGKKKFAVNLDFGGRSAQLRYCVVRPEFKVVHPLSQFRFERALGFGLGDWNYIVEENVDDVFSLFGDLVEYCFDLPDRIKAAILHKS
jgi:hypothetical protein